MSELVHYKSAHLQANKARSVLSKNALQKGRFTNNFF